MKMATLCLVYFVSLGHSLTAETSCSADGCQGADASAVEDDSLVMKTSLLQVQRDALEATLTRDPWLIVKGPKGGGGGTPVARISVDALNAAEKTWKYGELSFYYTDNVGIVALGGGLPAGKVPAGLASTDGKFYFGPTGPLPGGKGMVFCVYDTPPTIAGYSPPPKGYTSTLPSSEAKMDSTTIALDSSTMKWKLNVKPPPTTIFKDVTGGSSCTGGGCKLVEGQEQVVDSAPTASETAYEVDFETVDTVYVQRYQGGDWWAIVQNSASWPKIAPHFQGSMKGCSAANAPGSLGYGCAMVPGAVWQ